MTRLPIEDVLPELLRAIAAHPAVVLQAPPGAGKTTRVPLALLDAPWLAGRAILILEPRRLAARAAAARMADLLGETVGERVGYRVRFDHQVSARTRIEVLTEGILARRLQADPELDGVGLVIFDEFHERNLHADLALALCLDVLGGLRDDLKLLVMSATLDTAGVAAALERALGRPAPTLTSEGRAHPVDIRYLAADPEGDPALHAATAVRRALREEAGDILVFLPGGGEIRRCQERLGEAPETADCLLLPLYGDLPKAEQERAILPDPRGRRKIVLASPIAETSLTIEGVRVVVDAGLARVPRFDPPSGLTRLDTQRIARDAAEQRAGRAGRLGPGVCYRLWSRGTQQSLLARRVPELLNADLAPLLLELAQWGVADPHQLAWLDPPPAGALAQARELLRDLEALDADGRLTATGRAMAALPVHPRLAHMLARAQALNQLPMACDLAALLEERDIYMGTGRGADLEERLEALADYRQRGRPAAQAHGADPNACARAVKAAQQFRHLLPPSPAQGGEKGVRQRPGPHAPEAPVGLLLALAYPDRVARRREEGGYRLANGRGARFTGHDPLVKHEFLAIGALGGRAGGDGQIFLAAPLALEDLRHHLAGRIQTGDMVEWDSRQEAVIARREERLGQLVLSSRPLERPAPEATRQAMLTGIAQMGLAALPWTPALRQWQARVQCLGRWCPEEAWPEVSDARLLTQLADWLGPYLDGIVRREHLARLDLAAALHALLPWPLAQRLEEGAPERLEVPSGSRLPLEYSPDAPPVLAVRLQEMFGLADTPRVAWGRVPVTLHLLSPAHRSIQVTQDLKGFWERTYAEVKKELKGRYPKHAWPDDPWTAPPTARAKRRG